MDIDPSERSGAKAMQLTRLVARQETHFKVTSPAVDSVGVRLPELVHTPG